MTPQKPMNRKEYLEWSKTLTGEGCMLCDWEKQQIVLNEFAHWVLVYSVAPYKKYNMMLVPKRHIEFMHDVSGEEFEDLRFVMARCYDYFHRISTNSEYMWLWRTRDETFGSKPGEKLGKRLNHLHLHFIPEVTRWLDPILEADAADEAVFNRIKDAIAECEASK